MSIGPNDHLCSAAVDTLMLSETLEDMQQYLGIAAYLAAPPGPNLPATADHIGQLFIRTGPTSPGLYVATDLSGSWSGPLGQ